jgi:hypothetical protein
VILATDTTKTRCLRPAIRLGKAHLAFLDEMVDRFPVSSKLGDASDALCSMRRRFDAVATHMTPRWRERLGGALGALAQSPATITSRGLAHGDFTPWNSLVCGDRLYVFDWEYAGWDYPADYDLIHFLSATPALLGGPAQHYVSHVISILTTQFDRSRSDARARLMAYVCARTLRYACREPRTSGQAIDWAGSARGAVVLDALLAECTG